MRAVVRDWVNATNAPTQSSFQHIFLYWPSNKDFFLEEFVGTPFYLKHTKHLSLLLMLIVTALRFKTASKKLLKVLFKAACRE